MNKFCLLYRHRIRVTTQMAKTDTKRKTATRIPPAVEMRIIELSAMHPEFGARRLLPLLQKESIAVSASSIYNILKRHGLQNRDKRFAKIQAQPGLEALPPQAVGHPPPTRRPGIPPAAPRSKARPREENRRPTPGIGAAKAPFCKGRPAFERPAQKKIRIPLVPKLVCVSLLAVLVFSGLHAVLKVRRVRKTPQTNSAAIPGPIQLEKKAAEIDAITPLAEDIAVRKRDEPDLDSRSESLTGTQPLPPDSKLPPYLSGARPYRDSPWSFSLAFEELEAWHADARRLWQDATLEPYTKDDLPAGFTITDIQPDAIYKKMGLQNGDVIQAVNGEAITGPEQAVYFFQKVAEGGVVEIKIRRRRRNRYISLTIQ